MIKRLGYILMTLMLVIMSQAQNIPKEYSFSYDGSRLVRGKEIIKGLYDETVVKRVDLTFTQSNWKALLTANKSSQTDLAATMVMDGKTYSGVGVRYKGQTSYTRVTGDKKSFNITIDFTDKTQDIDGYETMNFNNSFEDNSFMRELFYENYTRAYTPSLKVAYVHLYINGENYGLYPHVQGLDSKYIKEWFTNNNGTRWRCERTTGGGGGGGGFGAGTSTLNYLGDDTTLYKPHYTLKNTEQARPWDALVAATKALANTQNVDSLNDILHVDEALWFLAKEIVFGDDDSYVNKGGMDYFAYFDVATGRLVPLEYDANSVMSGQTINWDLFLKENTTTFPLCNKLFKIPELRQRYLAHVRTMANDLFNATNYTPVIDKYFKLIDTFVASDSKKLMTYAEFTTGVASLKTWMFNRGNYLNNHIELKQKGVPIRSVNRSVNGILNKTPDANKAVDIVVKTDTSIKVSSLKLYYGTGYDGKFTRITMFDDGKHSDSAAHDGIYGAQIPGHTHGTYIRYYVEAIASNGFNTASYFPEGAEHDVFIYRVNLETSILSDIVINEVVSANKTTAKDQDNEFDDWIELYNNSNKDINISRWILTDNPDNLDKYRFPYGTVLKANNYLIVWADEDGKQTGFHANFKLSSDGEPLLLLDSTSKAVDQITIPALADDEAYARMPNGTGSFVKTSKFTFNKNNAGTTPATDLKVNQQIRLYPNPATNHILIESLSGKIASLKIYNLLGQLYFDQPHYKTSIDVTTWPRGTYILKSEEQKIKFVLN